MGLATSPGAALREIRESAGLNQATLADRLQVDQSHVSKVENGRCEVSLSAMLAWASACGFELELSGGAKRIKVPSLEKQRNERRARRSTPGLAVVGGAPRKLKTKSRAARGQHAR